MERNKEMLKYKRKERQEMKKGGKVITKKRKASYIVGSLCVVQLGGVPSRSH